MKTKLLAVLAASGAMLAQACSVDATGTGEEDVVGDSSLAACNEPARVPGAADPWTCGRQWNGNACKYDVSSQGLTQNKKFEVEASIPVALIKETGRLQPELDLEKVNNKIQVKSSGACGTNGCPETRMLLSFQTTDTVNRIQEVNGLANLLVAHWDRFQSQAMQSWTGCSVSGQHINLGNVVPATAQEIQAAGASTAGVCTPYGVPDSQMYWYKASQNAGKLWCKLMAFGGPSGTNGNPENAFLKYAANGSLEGFDPIAQTPVAITSSAANTAAGNTALYIGNGAAYFSYTRAETPGITYTHSTSGTNLVKWEGLGCYANGRSGTYQRHTTLPLVYLVCRY
jgi:hypothetical protein